ncbi:15204_t:CDS:2, partial [Funneliformis geosporum]
VHHPEKDPRPNKKAKKSVAEVLSTLDKFVATLRKEVDLRYILTAYSTSYPLQSGLCNCCGFQLNNDDVVSLTCGHNYHSACYRKDILTQDDLNDENNEEKEKESEAAVNEQTDISVALAVAIDNINNW